MYEYIIGGVTQLTPTYVIIETGGIGYLVNISLQAYSKLEGLSEAKLYLHQIVREDAHLLFGFIDDDERKMFRLLLNVSGIGANTARVMLSSLSSADICNAINTDDVNKLKSVKGIGLKTAQRVILDLKDKVTQLGIGTNTSPLSGGGANKEEALAALVALGFTKAPADKALDAVIKKEGEGLTVEQLIKTALKQL